MRFLAKSILIVCKANFCRSPVAKKLLSKTNPDLTVDSAGIIYFPKFSMDDRSISFLSERGFDDLSHMPKKINNTLVKEYDLILGIDLEVTLELLKLFPKYKGKIKAINYLDPNININDPYKYKNYKDYFFELEKLESLILLWSENLVSNK